MGTQFESCNDTVTQLLRQVMRDHHNALNANCVSCSQFGIESASQAR